MEYFKTDKNGTRYYHDWTCTRCGGSGRLSAYMHIDYGVCYKCGGSGILDTPRVIKFYTDEHSKVLEERREKRAEKKRKEAIAKSGEKNSKFKKFNGFNEDGFTWIVLGDTFDIKEELKEKGAKYSQLLRWHLPYDDTNYNTLKINIDDIYMKNYVDTYIDQLVDGMNWDTINSIITNAEEELNRNNDTTSFVGNLGDKITIDVTLEHIGTFISHFSYYGEVNYIYNFTDDNGNTLVWKTSKDLEKEIGDKLTLTATVKAHDEYKGKKQTVITRCKIVS